MDEENDLDVTESGGEVKEAASKVKSGAQKTKQTAQNIKKLTDKFKKGKNAAKAAKAAANVGKAAGHLSKLGPALPYVLIAIVIIIVVVGLVGFLMSMPGMLTGKLKEFAQKFADFIEALYVGNAAAQTNEDDIVKTANYIKSMGYDLIGYGFIPANTEYSGTIKDIPGLENDGYTDPDGDGIYKNANGTSYSGNYIGGDGIVYVGSTGEKYEAEEAGRYVDKYGIYYSLGEEEPGDEKGVQGTYETSGDIAGFASSYVDTTIISRYLTTNTRQFIIRNFDQSVWDDVLKVAIGSIIGGPIGTAVALGEIAYSKITDSNLSKGLISLWNSEKGIATSHYDAIQFGSVKVDSNSKTMSIKGSTFSNPINYKMDGWTGRYGLSLEFLLSLHLATMAPELVETMTTAFDTDIQVYLDQIGDDEEEVKVTGYFKTDDGKYMTIEDMEETEREDGIKVGSAVISNKDGFAVMKKFGIKSRDYGEFACEHGKTIPVLWKDNEVVSDITLTDMLTSKDKYIHDVIKGKGEDAAEEYPEIMALGTWTDVYNALNDDDDENDKYIDGDKLWEIVYNIGYAKMYVLDNHTDYQEIENVVSGSIPNFENLVTFDEIKRSVRESASATSATIATYEHKTDPDNNGKIHIKFLVWRTSVDHNWDFSVIVYKDLSPNELKSDTPDLCSDHFEDGTIQSVCTPCEKYVESIRSALNITDDQDYEGKVPYIARVLDSWFRDTYFVVPTDEAAKEDKAIEYAYSGNNQYGHDDVYSESGRKLSGKIDFIAVDNEYLEDTGEHWTQYELNDDGTYKLYRIETNGSYGAVWEGTREEAKEQGIEVMKKPILVPDDKIESSDNDFVWTAYNFSSTMSDEKVPVEIETNTNKHVKKVSLKKSDTEEYEERVYYSFNKVRTTEQVEDGQRGITNTKIKRMFKNRKYYIYDGTSERAEAIYKDWQKVLEDNGAIEDPERELFVEQALDDLYYETSSTTEITFTEDPRDPDLIGNIDINKDSLSAFSILENTRTLDADYAYRDFKELIVELDYFDKEDLSDKTPEIFTWIVPEITEAWPIRMIDKDENYYGTYIHSDEAIKNIKVSLGLVDEEELEEEATEEETDDEEDKDVKQIMNAKGYTYVDGATSTEDGTETEDDAADTTGAETEEGTAAIGEVVSPVTGEVVGYGTYERTNTDLVKYEKIAEEDAKETVGYIQIKIADSEKLFDFVEGMTEVGITSEEDDNKYSNAQALNAYFEEYEGVCDGYIITIDGIKLLDGATDLASFAALSEDSFKVTEGFKANITPNIVDEEQEKINQQKEEAKAVAPAVVKNGDRIFVREGTIIGYTTKNENEASDKDYSYMRVILRNDERSLRENVENYFDLPFSMDGAFTPVQTDFPEEFIFWMGTQLEGACEGKYDLGDKYGFEVLNDGAGHTTAFGLTKHIVGIAEEGGYTEFGAHLASDNGVPKEEAQNVFLLVIESARETILNRITDHSKLSESMLDALVEFNHLNPSQCEQLCNRFNNNGTLTESDFLSLVGGTNEDYVATWTKRAKTRAKLALNEEYYNPYNDNMPKYKFLSDTPWTDFCNGAASSTLYEFEY